MKPFRQSFITPEETRFAAHEFFLGAIRNQNARRAYMHAAELFLAWAGKHGRGQLTNIAPWEVGAYMGELAKTTRIATRNQHLSGLRHFPVDGALKDRCVFMGIAESRGVEVSDDGLLQVVGHRDFPATCRPSFLFNVFRVF